jgi:hypothetical protein
MEEWLKRGSQECKVKKDNVKGIGAHLQYASCNGVEEMKNVSSQEDSIRLRKRKC